MELFKIEFVLVASCLGVIFCTAEDITLKSGQTGTPVVEACIAKIYGARIFNEDYNFLRRLAYAESTDGSTLEQGEINGIWNVNGDTITFISNSTYNVSSYYPAILAAFNINWTEVTHSQMLIPLYSALARRLHLAHLENTVTEIPTAVLNQGIWWAVYIHSDDDSVLANNFETAIAPIDTGCSKPNRDIVFLVDSTNLVTYLERSKNIITNIIKQLKIDSNLNETVVGISQYSNQVVTSAYLNGSFLESNITSVVAGLQPLSGSRMTATAIRNVISDVFNVANGAKGWASGTPQILCLFTAGSSFDSVLYIADNASQSAVTIMAIGISEDITNEELNTTASDPNIDHSFHVGNYTTDTLLEYALTRQICSETALVPSSAQEISGSIGMNESLSLTISVPSTGLTDSSVAVSSGSMAMYYSDVIEEPSSANYDNQLLVESPGQTVPFTFVPTARSAVSVDLYVTLENTFAGITHFTITLSSDEDVTVYINLNNGSTNATTETPSGGSSVLTEGEIAGIVFSCLIVVCAILVAVVYYRFGKPNVKKRPLFHNDDLDRPMDSREAPSPTKQVAETRFKTEDDSKEEFMLPTTIEEFLNDSHKNDVSEMTEQEAQQKRLEISVRERLNSAVRRKDIPDITEAVEDFIALRLEDVTGDFVTAQRILAVQQCKQGLTRAIHSKNIKNLEKAIMRGKRMEYDMELKMELMNAEILLQDLKKVDNLLRRLKRAMDASDLESVESITAELRILKGCDQAMIERMLTIFQFKEDLEEAMERRDTEAIKESIGRIEARGFVYELAAELKQANRLLRDLAMMEKARNDVMGLKQSSVSEIRSYATPPPGVHEIMTAVYLLLGYHPVQLDVWTSIQGLMGKTGRESLRRLIGGMNITSVDILSARMAKSLLANFDLNAIRDISEALSVFYIFAKTAIKEVEKFLPDAERDSMASWSDISTPLINSR